MREHRGPEGCAGSRQAYTQLLLFAIPRWRQQTDIAFCSPSFEMCLYPRLGGGDGTNSNLPQLGAGLHVTLTLDSD